MDVGRSLQHHRRQQVTALLPFLEHLQGRFRYLCTCITLIHTHSTCMHIPLTLTYSANTRFTYVTPPHTHTLSYTIQTLERTHTHTQLCSMIQSGILNICINIATTHIKAGVWVLDVGFGGGGKEEVEGHREVGQVGPEGVVLCACYVMLQSVMEHHPVQPNAQLHTHRKPQNTCTHMEREIGEHPSQHTTTTINFDVKVNNYVHNYKA